jgi:hypothetical protein
MKLSTKLIGFIAALGAIALGGMPRIAQANQTQSHPVTTSTEQHPAQAIQAGDGDGETDDDTTSLKPDQPEQQDHPDQAAQQDQSHLRANPNSSAQADDANDRSNESPNDADSAHEDAH